MRLYFLRHAIALPRGTHGIRDEDRPLTEKGRNRMEQEAVGINRIITTFDVILTSPYKRAYETAMITARALGLTSKLKKFSFLTPGTPYTALINGLKPYRSKAHILLVGHEPAMSMTIATLLGMDEPAIDFKKGSLCCLEIDAIPPHVPGTLCWLLKPSHLRDLGSS
jgi:phosphohistidine phosphatase